MIPQQEKYMASPFRSGGLVLQVTENRMRLGQVMLCHGWLLNAFWIIAHFSSHFASAFISKTSWCNCEEKLKISEFCSWKAETFLWVCRWEGRRIADVHNQWPKWRWGDAATRFLSSPWQNTCSKSQRQVLGALSFMWFIFSVITVYHEWPVMLVML